MTLVKGRTGTGKITGKTVYIADNTFYAAEDKSAFRFC